MRFCVLTVIVSIFFILNGCGQKRIYVPSGPPPFKPAKQLPPGARVPATQKPYRIKGHAYYPLPSAHGYHKWGRASWYGKPFHGRKTSNGETYDMHSMTAAHKVLPMNTHLLVRNMENGREAIVRVNDRGPFVKGRIIDLSYAAAKQLGVVKKGTAKVELTALGEAVTVRREGRAIERFLPYQDLDRKSVV